MGSTQISWHWNGQDGPAQFRRPSHMSEKEIYQMFKDEIAGK
jgi:hypothetical protein